MAGAIIGAAIFLFPPLYGEGYGVISDMLAEDMAALIPYGLFARERVDTGLVLLLSGGMMLVKAFAILILIRRPDRIGNPEAAPSKTEHEI